MTGKNIADLPLLEKHNFLLIFSSLAPFFLLSTYVSVSPELFGDQD